MKILQVCAFAAPYPGNFISSILELNKRVRKLNGEVIYAFPEEARNLSWCKDLERTNKIYYLPTANARILPKTYKICRQIFRENKIDIVHSHFELYDIPITTMAPKNVKIFWHLHDPIEDIFKKSSKLRKLLWLIQYKQIGKNITILSVSKKHAEFLKSIGFKGNIEYIPNGIDLNRVGKKVEKNKTTTFLMFGWDVYRKGVDLVISASQDLFKEKLKSQVICVGQDNCKEYISNCNNNNKSNVVYYNPKSNVNELYNIADIFLHVSRSEGLSYALLEAIYFGLPVICSDIEENLFAKEFYNVYFVKNNSSEDIYNKMKAIIQNGIIINDDELEMNRKLIYDNYSLEAWSKKILEKYKMV